MPLLGLGVADAELNRRLASFEASRKKALPWESVKARILRSRRTRKRPQTGEDAARTG